jgi:hypothetical protein
MTHSESVRTSQVDGIAVWWYIAAVVKGSTRPQEAKAAIKAARATQSSFGPKRGINSSISRSNNRHVSGATTKPICWSRLRLKGHGDALHSLGDSQVNKSAVV